MSGLANVGQNASREPRRWTIHGQGIQGQSSGQPTARTLAVTGVIADAHQVVLPDERIPVREDAVTDADVEAALNAVRKTVAYGRFLSTADYRLCDELARVTAAAVLRGQAI